MSCDFNLNLTKSECCVWMANDPSSRAERMGLIPKKCFLSVTLGLAVLCSGCLGPFSNRGPTGCPASGKATAPNTGLEVATLQSAQPSGCISAFWNVDRQYLKTPTLTPHSHVTIAELTGPGAITLLRISNIPQVADAGLLRGVVLEIYFDGAEEPAVLCPLPDFFGDGCNGKAIEFASRFVEKVPVAWNAYFPMPFKQSARVNFRNDTDLKTTAYAYLEWEELPRWNSSLGYLHATYQRFVPA